MRRSRTAGAARWITACLAAGAALTWVASLRVGLYSRSGVYTLHIEDGAVSLWKATPNPAYALADDTHFYRVQFHSLQSYAPLFSSTPGRFDWITRVPLWIPLLIGGAPAAILWLKHHAQRRRTGHCPSCGYDLRGLVTGSACPECGPTSR